jgi:hypothetical protein
MAYRSIGTRDKAKADTQHNERDKIGNTYRHIRL